MRRILSDVAASGAAGYDNRSMCGRRMFLTESICNTDEKIGVGDLVRVTRGPFEDYTGSVVNIDVDGLIQISFDLSERGLVATFFDYELEITRRKFSFKMI